MNVNDVKCPTCRAVARVTCKPFTPDERVPHIGRVRVARAHDVGKTLRFRHAHYIDGGWSAYDVSRFWPHGGWESVGTVWQTREARWTCALPDGTVVTRDWRGTRATCAAFLLDPILPEVAR